MLWVAFDKNQPTMPLPIPNTYSHIYDAYNAMDISRPNRVLIFGASTVHGDGLLDPLDENFVHLLRRYFKEQVSFEIWADSGAIMDDILSWEEEALTQPADLVILYYTFNEGMNRTNKSFLKAFFEANIFSMLKSFYSNSDWMRENHKRLGLVFENKVTQFTTLAKSRNAEVILIGEVCAEYVIYEDYRHGIRLYHNSLAKVAQQEGCIYIDMAQDFFTARNSLLFVDSVHLNSHGHKILAKKIAAALQNFFLKGQNSL